MKKVKLETGRKASRGFTLIEILLSVTVLVTGLFFIYPAFFRSADILSRIAVRYETSALGRDLIEQARNTLHEKKSQDAFPYTGRRVIAGNEYEYTVTIMPADKKNRSYRVQANIKGSSGQLSRTAVVLC